VLVVKLIVFAALRIYREDLRHYGLGEALRVLRANLMASVSVVAVLTMLQRTGLSRGVVAIDFLLLSVLTLWGRFSFRIMETLARRWSHAGTAAVLVGAVDDLEPVLLEMERGRWPELRPVALADRRGREAKGRFKGYPLFGKGDGPQRALEETGAGALVFVEREEEDMGSLRRGTGGGGLASGVLDVEVYTLRVGMSLARE